MKKIRTLVVDDESLPREGILSLLAGDAEIEVVGTCADGQSALDAINNQRPDLVFLDVQMPKISGFDVLAQLKPAERPAVIFCTAYDQYAIAAFEVQAIDYLLKPFADGRFFSALSRAKAEIRRGTFEQVGQKLEKLLGSLQEAVNPGLPVPAATGSSPPADERVVLKTGSDLNFIMTADIVWIESQGDFIRVHTTGAAHMARETLKSLEQRLAAGKFLRIHRSTLVNLSHVRKATPALYGDYLIVLSDGTQLRLSRRHRGKIKDLIDRLSALQSG